MVGSPACRSTMSWHISGGSVFEVSLSPPCSPEENRLCIPYCSNSSALRDNVRWGTSISFARSPAVSWYRTRGRIASYSSCSGHNVHCLILAHSSVRSRRLRFGPGISPAFRLNDDHFKRTRPSQRLQEVEGIVARLDAPPLPV